MKNNDEAEVSGFARSFLSGEAIADGTVWVKENPDIRCKTDSQGKFGPIKWEVGKPITLIFEKEGSYWTGYRTTQSPTMIVPEGGINSPDYLKNVSFQVPSNMAINFLSWAMWVSEDTSKGQIAATVTLPGKTMDDIPQGVEDVTVALTRLEKDGVSIAQPLEIINNPFYFGIFPVIDKTNPFVWNLKSTSLDGGVMFINVAEGMYRMEAKKDGVTFSTITVESRKGVLCNASPPNGPTVITQSKTNEIEKKK